MSSILEALKELEGRNAPVMQSTAALADRWVRSRRAAEVLGIITVGLVIGAGLFFLFVWLAGTGSVEEPIVPADAGPPAASASAAAPAPAPTAATQAAPSPSAPAPGAADPSWLARAEPPRGRVLAGPARPGPHAAGDAPAAAAVPADDPAPPKAARGGPAPSVTVAAIHYADVPGQRTVTLQVGGSATTAHEGETVHGIELQLITPDAVYVRRGAEVIMLTPGS